MNGHALNVGRLFVFQDRYNHKGSELQMPTDPTRAYLSHARPLRPMAVLHPDRSSMVGIEDRRIMPVALGRPCRWSATAWQSPTSWRVLALDDVGVEGSESGSLPARASSGHLAAAPGRLSLVSAEQLTLKHSPTDRAAALC